MVEISATATQHHGQRAQPPMHRIGLLLGILAAFALRLFHLGATSLWYDETVSVVLARKAIPALLAHTAGDIHPPGYYLLLRFWQQLTTPTVIHGLEFLFAWPSLWWGMLIVALTYTLGRRLFSPAVALLALGLAAIQPLQIWYSQEVRMYTLGALLGMVTLWALLNYFAVTVASATGLAARQPIGHWRWLLLYALAGALGLYTLYYFLFLLVSLNAMALLLLLCPRQSGQQGVEPWVIAARWVGAQFLVLLLWLPWLPIFWRQATDPPVPPWRAPWQSVTDFSAMLSESVSALLSGQSAPAPTHWLWLLIGLVLLVSTHFYYTNNRAERTSVQLLLLYTLLPLATLLVISLVAAPIYHVRYLMLYAPPLVLLLAALVEALSRRWRPLGWFLLALLVSSNGWSLQRFWLDPRFQPDDHRAAVAQLAAAWRPGDLILVNAGWVYTTLETYWPAELSGADAAVPPPLQQIARLHDYANELTQRKKAPLAPIVVRSGSLDGDDTLGWGDPASDFFALNAAVTTAALQTVRQQHTRLWHYRLYDTVNDPAGIIRAWLEDEGTLSLDQPIPGRDFLRLQRYDFEGGAGHLAGTATQIDGGVVGLRLIAAQPISTTVAAGSTAYVATQWQRQADATPLPPLVSFSLRLYDERSVLVAQQDERPWPEPHTWSTSAATTLTLALPLPVATQPGSYRLQLLLYDGHTGTPIASMNGEATDSLLTVGALTVVAARQSAPVETALLRFDYIDLLQLPVTQPTVPAGGTLALDLRWQPQPNPYQDTYVMQWGLRDQAGVVIQQWTEPLGSWEYPSGGWPANQPVRQQPRLTIDPTISAGAYRLTLQLIRHSDGERIAPHRPWSQWWRSKLQVGPRTTAPLIEPDGTLLVADILVQ